MKIRALCPGCGRTYGVNPDQLGPAGADFACKDCGTPFRISSTGEIHNLGPGESAGLDAARRPVEVIDPSGPPAGAVTCPRCHHQFVPAAAATTPPAAATAEPAPSAAAPSPEPGITEVQRPTVLVVEDTAYFRELVKETLGDRYRMVLVSSRKNAVETLRREKVDLLLLDLSLDDDEDGRDVLREMGEKQCPILIFTARDEEEMYGDCWDELQSLGADDMLIKGMNVGENLLAKVEHLLSERP
ncbi:MAG: response regulator [Acidobacteriota bacterium]